ncbi:hypothetical protein GCM10008905_15900 [Clostridium malenominatum]|uniref:Uncharacterized protein n=1 Tax=Clostridium malenominatum TaxID=1539 RepID=A0ABN1IXY1_9CLOT
MDSNMMNMCNMCMHKAYCPMAAGMKPMGMHQMPMNMDMDIDMDMDMDMNMGMDMDMENLQNMGLMQDMNLTEDMMDNMRDGSSIKEDTEDIATNADFIEDEDFDFTRRPKDKHNHHGYNCDVDHVLRKLERNNPGIFRRLTMCGMPYFQARRFVGRIVSLSLDYCRD